MAFQTEHHIMLPGNLSGLCAQCQKSLPFFLGTVGGLFASGPDAYDSGSKAFGGMNVFRQLLQGCESQTEVTAVGAAGEPGCRLQCAEFS